MGKIFCLMGKSSSGKDTIYKALLNEKKLSLQTIVLYTTRPKRDGEVDGLEYHFVKKKDLELFQKKGILIEVREYKTIYGIWYYFTVDDGQVNLDNNYLLLGTLESYKKIRNYYGTEHVIPIYIEVEDGIRLERALMRERKQKEPKYAEMCRRFLADEKDFSEENIKMCGIKKRYQNFDLERCKKEIIVDIMDITLPKISTASEKRENKPISLK